MRFPTASVVLPSADLTMVVLMMDRAATTLDRIWCVFEVYTTIDKDKDLEVWTPLGRVGSGAVADGPIVQALEYVRVEKALCGTP